MQKLSVFDSISLDGYFTDARNDITWAHGGGDDPEWNQFVASNGAGGGTLIFGRVTYEMMVAYWPTPAARKDNPAVAEHMNTLQKVVFSRTLKNASWQNTTLVKDDLIEAVRELKGRSGPGITILGSGKVVSQLAQANLIDGYQFVIVPVVLGSGRTLFDGVGEKIDLERTDTRTFTNGNVVNSYRVRG